jgi:hypoxanthine phosphoribosyltransferase
MQRELLISRDQIRERVREMAVQISGEYRGAELVLIGVLNGVIFFFADLAREMGIPFVMDFVRAASYGSAMTSSGRVRLTKDVEVSIEGKSVILVEDIVDTGLTLSRILENIEGRGPLSVKTCVLIDKLERREAQVRIDYRGFQVAEGFLVGYGLDYDEQYRNLPDIHVLK